VSAEPSNWYPFDGGRSVGTPGSEAGTILADDEHALGARITLERDGATAPFAITCGIYGWMMHTRLFGAEADARLAYDAMRQALGEIMLTIPLDGDPDRDAHMTDVMRRIGDFIERFP
jgi:hypothetical protein